jgi:hypothetical protein
MRRWCATTQKGNEMTDSPDLPAELEATLAKMSDGEFAALTAKVRAPDVAESFRDIAAGIVPADHLDSLMRIANPAAFATDGRIDESKVRAHLGQLFGADQPQNSDDSSSTKPPPGARARSALERRYGVTAKPAAAPERPGDTARAALEKRHGNGSRPVGAPPKDHQRVLNGH